MLFNWFKKKDKLVPLDPAGTADSSQKPVKPNKPFAHSAHGKPLGRPAMAGVKKPAQAAKDTAKLNTSESTVIRIGKLGEVLLQYNMVSRENLEKALAIQQQSFIPSGPQDKSVQKRKLLGEILIENNFVTEDQLLSAFARHCRIPYIKLNKYGLPKAAIKSVPEDLIAKHKVMPVDKIGSMLMLAVTDPYDTNAVEEIKARTGLKVKTILCKPSEFAEMVKFYYPHITEPQPPLPEGINSVPLVPTNGGDNFGDEKPADIPSETIAPDVSAPAEGGSASGGEPKTTQEPSLGEETAVFKIEELPFPEPPAAPPIPINRPTEDKAIHQEQAEPLPDQPPTETVAENIQEIPASQAVSTITENPAIPTDRQVTAAGVAEKQPEAPPEDIPNRLNNTVEQIEQTNPSSSDEISEPTLQPVELPPETEGKKESFLGGEIEETVPTNLPAAENLPKAQPASPVHEETKTEPDSEISSQPLQNQEPESPNQQPPVTAGVNGYDTSLIDIQDLITLQQNSPDENIEIITEELEPIDVAPYIYPGTKEPEDAIPSASQTPIEQQPLQNEPQPSVTEITQEVKQDKKPQPGKIELVAQIETTGKNESPGRPAAEKTQPPPIPPLLPESGNKTFKENPVLVSDDEFLIAQQLFTTQLTHSWEKLYHRSKPSRAEKVDESEFVFYTETAVH